MSDSVHQLDSGSPELTDESNEEYCGDIFPQNITRQNEGDIARQIGHDVRGHITVLKYLSEIFKPVIPQEEELLSMFDRSVDGVEHVVQNSIKSASQTRSIESVFNFLTSSFENGWINDIKRETGRNDWKVVLEPLPSDITNVQIISSDSGWKAAVLPNFVKNAVQAGADTIVIRFTRYNDYGKDALAVEIIDNGHGMNKAVIEKLVKGQWHSSGKTMRQGDSPDDHNHGFPSAKRTIAQWGARLQIVSREADAHQPGRTVMRIIFNGATSKMEDFPDIPAVAEDSSSPPIPFEVIQEFIEGTGEHIASVAFDLEDIVVQPEPEPSTVEIPAHDLETFINGEPTPAVPWFHVQRTMSRRALGTTLAASIGLAAVGTYTLSQRRQRLSNNQSMLRSLNAQSPEQQHISLQPLSRIAYDNNGLITAVTAEGWEWERGKDLPHLRVTEITGRDGHILAFESTDEEKYPHPKIALSTVPGRTFGFIDYAGRGGYFSLTDKVQDEVSMPPDSVRRFTDAIFRAEGLSAGNLEMFSDNVLGEKNGALEVLVRAERRRKAKAGEGFAYSAAVLLDVAMRIRDARNINNRSIDTFDELQNAIEQQESFFALISDSLKTDLRSHPLSQKKIGNAPAPGKYFCLPSTDKTEAQDFINLSA